MIGRTTLLAALALSPATWAVPALDRRQASSAASAVSSSAASVASSASSAVSSASSAASSASSSGASASSSASASAASPSSSASSYASGLLAAISARNAPALASLIGSNPAIANAIVSQLNNTSQNFTLLAPSDPGLAAATANIDTSNTTLVTQLLSYHVIPGYYPATFFTPNLTYVLGTAIKQEVVLRRDQYLTTHVIGGQNSTVLANSTYQNVLIKLIDNALVLPGNISTTLGRVSLGQTLLTTLASVAPSLVQQLDTANMITVFAPSNQAISNVQSQLTALASNPQQLQQLILAHVVNGSTLYSNAGPNNLAQNSGTQNAAGSQLTFATNATGIFVTGNGVTAQVLQSDIITSNGQGKPGVVYIIDRVLAPAAAASSSASGSAVAAGSASASGASSSAVASASGVASSASQAASGAVGSASAAVASAAAAASSAA